MTSGIFFSKLDAVAAGHAPMFTSSSSSKECCDILAGLVRISAGFLKSVHSLCIT